MVEEYLKMLLGKLPTYILGKCPYAWSPSLKLYWVAGCFPMPSLQHPFPTYVQNK